jgi:ABC-2 type transport system permease protein
MNVFLHELRMSRGFMLTWFVAFIGLSLMYISLYPAFAHDATATKEMLENLPEAVRSVFSLDFTTILSFLGFYAFILVEYSLFAAFFAMYIGLSIPSRESRSKTTDFLLTKPRSRTSLFFQKMLAGLFVVVCGWGVMTVSTLVFTRLFNVESFDMTNFMNIQGALLILLLWFYAAGLLVSQLVRRIKSVVALTFGIVFGLFAIGMVQGLIGDEKLRYFSPFRYFNFADLASGQGFEPQFLIVALASLLVAVIVSGVLYIRRDVRAVA